MKQRKEYWTGSHTKHRMMYHIIWIPKYKKRVLEGEIGKRIDELIRECAEMNRWRIEELNVQKDHVHLLIQLKPDISVSKVVQLIKGKSSFVIRKEFPKLKEFFWGKMDSFWADGYFVETVGTVNEEAIKKYIQQQ
jgi:putative transposase